MPAYRIRFPRHQIRSSREKVSMRHSVLPAMGEILTVRARQLGDSILLQQIFPILQRSRCFRKVISSGESKRAASASRSKECHGNPRCLAGSSNFPTNGSGKSSWASTTGHINRLGLGNRRELPYTFCTPGTLRYLLDVDSARHRAPSSDEAVGRGRNL